ncbi:unnamed protein product [Taenia asiatica]|uniref:Gnk2-homologous domain-containing protein n=1 Tax=Taenia asiatica TaxID=60517 RepID=A0A158RA55_TAEAS|nr:unnamed protein product [Taenia asiatica]
MAQAAALRLELAVMGVKTIVFSTCLILEMIHFASQPTSAYMIAPQEYQSDQSQIVYEVPRRHLTKFKVFAECRRDCTGKCNHSLYAYLANKNECFTCLLECMLVFTEQAEKMGVSSPKHQSETSQKFSLDIHFPCLLWTIFHFNHNGLFNIRVNSEKNKRRTRRVTEFVSQPNLDKKKVTPRLSYPIRSCARSQEKEEC